MGVDPWYRGLSGRSNAEDSAPQCKGYPFILLWSVPSLTGKVPTSFRDTSCTKETRPVSRNEGFEFSGEAIPSVLIIQAWADYFVLERYTRVLSEATQKQEQNDLC